MRPDTECVWTKKACRPWDTDSRLCTAGSDHNAALFGLEGQLVAEVGVRDGDQLAGTLVVTTAPGVRMDLILLIVPPLAVEVKAMKLLPPRDWQAPRT